MDFETISAVVFLVILAVFVYLKRKDLDTKQIVPYFLYFSMYKTKIGIELMDSAARKWKRFVQYLGYFGIVVGFLGMTFICFTLVQSLIPVITRPEEAAQGVGLVLPVKAKGIFYVPFFYWIISIFVIAIVHEFAHGLVARAHNMKVKSSGFAFLALIVPIIPAAFVEPDEKELRKRSHKEQLSVFAAGPLANIITAFVFLALAYFVMAPLANAVIEPNGVKFASYYEGSKAYPAENAGIKIGEIIQEIDNKPTPYYENMSAILKSKKPGDVITIKTDSSSYQITLEKNPENESAAFMGISHPEQSTKVKDSIKASYGEALPNFIVWVAGLFVILFILNLGIGLFNLVPIGPLDGGRMLQLPLHKYFGTEKGNKILIYVSLLFFIIIIINVGAGFGLFGLFK
ncbi:site-2 protease family protein [Candidatus Woesearchaeota archaeon]|nr:site-2 protease family protein [Candidatus Woesearchaeota archaeon]